MSLLQIRINGFFCDLPTQARSANNRQNPHLVYDSILGSSAGIPTLPPTPKNKAIFENFDEVNLMTGQQAYECQQFFGGNLISEGYFVLLEANESGFVGVFTDYLSKLFGEISGKRLTDIVFPTTYPMSLIPNGAYPVGADMIYCLPTILNPDYYGSNAAAASYNNYVNYYTAPNYVTAGPKVPMFSLRHVLNQLALLSNITLSGDFMTNADMGRLIIYNTRAATTGGPNIKMAAHLPEITVEDLFLELRKLFNLSLKINLVTKTVRMDFRDTDIVLPCRIDWSDKAVRGGSKIKETNARIQLSCELDSGDALMKVRPTELEDYLTDITGFEQSGIAKISTKFSTLLVDSGTGLATAQQVGQTTLYGQGSNKFGPRLLFWHGVTSSKPRALPTYGTRSLYWAGADGLKIKHWQQTEYYKKRQYYLKKDFVLTERDIAQFDFTQKIHLNGMNYEVASLAYNLPLKESVSTLLVSR